MMLPVNSTEPSKPRWHQQRVEYAAATYMICGRDFRLRVSSEATMAQAHLVNGHNHAEHTDTESTDDTSQYHRPESRTKSLDRASDRKDECAKAKGYPSTKVVRQRCSQERRDCGQLGRW